MKNAIIKRSVSILLAVLMLVSVLAVSACAEELLPEANGGAIYNATATEETVTADSTDTACTDGAAEITEDGARLPMAEAPDPEPVESVLEEGDMGIPAPREEEAPQPTEAAPEAAPEPAPEEAPASNPEEDSAKAEPADDTDPNEAPHNAEAQADDAGGAKESGVNASAPASVSIVSCVDITATAIPHPHEKDPDIEGLKSDEQRLGEKIGDVIIKIGESTLPFGRSISNFFRNHGKRGEGVDSFEQTVDLVTDAANFVDPVFGPLVSVARDVILKIWHLF